MLITDCMPQASRALQQLALRIGDGAGQRSTASRTMSQVSDFLSSADGLIGAMAWNLPSASRRWQDAEKIFIVF